MTIKLIQPVIDVVQRWAKEAGVNEAPSSPTEGNIDFPYSLCYLRSADIFIDPGPSERDLVVFYLDIHLNRIDLPTDNDALIAIYELLKRKFVQNPTIENTVDTLNTSQTPLHVEYGKMQLGAQETLGLRWSFNVKIKEQGI